MRAFYEVLFRAHPHLNPDGSISVVWGGAHVQMADYVQDGDEVRVYPRPPRPAGDGDEMVSQALSDDILNGLIDLTYAVAAKENAERDAAVITVERDHLKILVKNLSDKLTSANTELKHRQFEDAYRTGEAKDADLERRIKNDEQFKVWWLARHP